MRFFLVGVILCVGSSLCPSIGAESVITLPHCPKKNTGYILISTLDGKLTSIGASGDVLWQTDTGPGPLLLSNIHNVEMSANGERVRLIPSLSGSLYKFNGKTIETIPMNADNLLKSSFLYGNNIVIAGSREVRTYGIVAKTGEKIYECTSDGCLNMTSRKDESEDVVLLERTTVTVRAHEARTGLERWNFSVGYHNVTVPSASCINLDYDIINLNISTIIPMGLVKATRSPDTEPVWERTFPTPIVKAWKWDGRNMFSLDLFSDVKPADVTRTNSPAIYVGMHDLQLYIHESSAGLEFSPNRSLLGSANTVIPWRPISATELTYDDETALSILTGSDSLNGNGYYLYSDNSRNSKNLLVCGKNCMKNTFKEYIMKEKYYWKEVLVIAITTAVIVNLFWNYAPIKLFEVLKRRKSESKRRLTETTESTKVSSGKLSEAFPSERTISESSNSNPFTSRFLKDFSTTRCLGRGGYGTVFEVKSLIDECGYAIKRITLPSETSSQQRVLREVKALAKLDHINIVRYCTSWVECPPYEWKNEFDRQWTSDFSTISSINEEHPRGHRRSNSTVIKINDDTFSFDSDSEDEDDFKIEFRNSKSDSLDIEFRASTDKLSASGDSNTSSGVSQMTSVSCSERSALLNECTITFLYIQMQLCKKESLKDWLNCNPRRTKPDSFHIYNQILGAVEYVHNQKLIHRDLKPSNIFFSQDGHIKVGDFGLATPMKNIDTEHSSYDSSVRSHTKGAGTLLYMSPEQINKKEYNYKVDIFSLGVILFELLVPFGTEMERDQILTNLRNGVYPTNFSSSFPKEHNLLLKMLSEAPENRPDTSEVRAMINTSQ